MPIYRVEIDGIEELKELEGSWQPTDYIAILQKMDVSGAAEIPAADLREMCVFALQDLDPPEAAALLLNYKLGAALSSGQIRNYSVESQHERLWEQSADLKIHQPMFGVASLLNAASPMVEPNNGSRCGWPGAHWPRVVASARDGTVHAPGASPLPRFQPHG